MTKVASAQVPLVPETFPGEKLLNGYHVDQVEVKSGAESINGEVEGYKIKEQWHSQPGHLRIIHVGAGAAGLLMAYKMKKDFQDYSLVCYEK